MKYVPGILLLLVLGFVAAMAAAMLPFIDYVLMALLVGMLWINTVGDDSVLRLGVGTYTMFLKAGIILLGAKFTLAALARIGVIGCLLVIVETVGAIAIMQLLGRLFGLRQGLTDLLAVGSAVCGVSAIAATSKVVNAKDEDITCSIATIVALGGWPRSAAMNTLESIRVPKATVLALGLGSPESRLRGRQRTPALPGGSLRA